MAPPLVTYHKDEKVLCFHHEILYEAKILDIRNTDPEDKKSPLEYAVHYKGWKSTYVIMTLRILPTFCPFYVVEILFWIPFMGVSKYWDLHLDSSSSSFHTNLHPVFCGGGHGDRWLTVEQTDGMTGFLKTVSGNSTMTTESLL